MSNAGRVGAEPTLEFVRHLDIQCLYWDYDGTGKTASLSKVVAL